MTRLAVALALSLLAGHAGAKPPNPFQGELAPAEIRARPGAAVDLSLTLRTLERFPAADVELRLPPGVDLLQGERRTRLEPVAKGTQRALRWRLRIRAPGEREVWVRIEAVGIAPSVAAAAFRAVVNPSPPPPPPTVKRGRDGTEYRVHEIPFGR